MRAAKGEISDTPGCSRRVFFQTLSIPVAGAAILLSASLRAEAKMAQASAGYQGTPKGDQSCSNCSLFAPPTSCSLVDGAISPQGWCRYHQTKK